VVQSVCEDFASGRLSFWFVAHWDLGAALAAHWYARALVACREPIARHLAARGLRGTDDADTALNDTLVFARAKGQLVGVYPDGQLLVDELEVDELGAADRKRIAEVASTRRCRCGLCPVR
jgi:hypothetical protein